MFGALPFHHSQNEAATNRARPLVFQMVIPDRRHDQFKVGDRDADRATGSDIHDADKDIRGGGFRQSNASR